MLNDAVGFERLFIAVGYTDLRRGIAGLASTIKFQFNLDPFSKAYPVPVLWKTNCSNQRTRLGRRWILASLQKVEYWCF